MKPPRLVQAAALSVLLLLPVSHNAFADEETEALKKEVKALEARIAQLEKRQQKQQAAAPASATNTNLAQRVAIVERNQELAQDDAKAKAETTPKVEVGSKGLAITSPDKQYSVNMHAYAQIDNRTFLDNGSGSGTNNFLVRTARPIVEAKMTDYFNARLMLDFGQGNSRVLDAYGDFHPLPGNDIINLRAGEFKVPVGIERWQTEQELLFVERSLSTNLVPFRDIGAMAYGQFIPDQLEYQLAILNGAPDLAVNTGDTDTNKDVAGRLFAHPLRWAGMQALQGIGIGIGGTYGVHQGSTTAPGLTTGYLTTGQRTFFAYSNKSGQVAYANGPQWRFNPQAMYYNGPFGAFGEYVRNNQELHVARTDRELSNEAWFATAGYVLTGEDASFDGVRPAHNFNPSAGDWGAFELVGRYGHLNVDKNAFPLFADATVSARSANEFTGGANWYFNSSVKFNFDYSFTSFDGGALHGLDREDEKVVLARTQVRF